MCSLKFNFWQSSLKSLRENSDFLICKVGNMRDIDGAIRKAVLEDEEKITDYNLQMARESEDA